MEFQNKKLRDVAEIARQIMVGEELKGNQKKIDKNHNGKIDGQDFKILRKEESEEVAEETIEEATPPKNTDIADKSYLKDMGKKPTVKSDLKNLGRFITGKKETNEEVDSAAATILEYESKDGKFVHRARPGAYGGTKDEKHAVDTLAGPKAKELKAIESEKKKKKFSEDLDLYKEGGIKGLFEAWAKKKKMAEDVEVLDEGIEVKKEYNDKTEAEHGVYHNNKKIGYVVHHKPSGTHTAYHSPQGDDDYGQIDDFHSHHDAVKQIRHSAGVGVHEEVEHISEEPTSAEFDAQLADAKQRAAGTKKQPEISKPAVQAVQNEETHTTVEFIDYNDVNGVKISEIDLEERSMTEPEMKKKEEIVKSMKKGISGFKDRYGDRAKEVMYATATKQAMKEGAEDHYQTGHDYASDHALDSGFKATARARKKEMLADNPHKKGSSEHDEWHKGALAGHQTGLDNM